MKLAYKIIRQNVRKTYQANKRYYDRTAKERTFKVGDVNLFNPARKPGQSKKFWKKWSGPFKVIAKVSKLNYRVVNPQGKEFSVHVNRLKLAHNQGIWQETPAKRSTRKHRMRRQTTKEDPEEICSPGPIVIPAPQVENGRQAPRSPNRASPERVDTPAESPLTPYSQENGSKLRTSKHTA